MSESLIARVENPSDFRLCFVSDGEAYFTDANDFDELRTEDWDKRYDMGYLYGTEEDSTAVVQTVLFTGPVRKSNHNLSPHRINERELVWLGTTNSADEVLSIHAKTPLLDFVDQVQRAGGDVYIPVSTGDE